MLESEALALDIQAFKTGDDYLKFPDDYLTEYPKLATCSAIPAPSSRKIGGGWREIFWWQQIKEDFGTLDGTFRRRHFQNWNLFLLLTKTDGMMFKPDGEWNLMETTVINKH